MNTNNEVKMEQAKAETADEMFIPFVANVKIDKKEYLKLSMHNMKRFLGMKQLALYLILLGAGLGLFFGFGIWLFLLLFGIVNLLVIAAVSVFIGTSFVGYKYEFVKTGVMAERITVLEDEIVCENLDKDGKVVFEESHEKSKIDKLALKKDRIYIFRSTAVYYYIKQGDVENGRFFELQNYLKETYPPLVFQLRKKLKMYPAYNNKEK